jgi:tRNA G10  N-methylase Trm11
LAYRYAVTRENYADLSGVLHSAPGFPAFPARLASEMFQRALALSPDAPARVWDPCCGSGYLLSALVLLHRRDITEVLGTDLDPAALALAQKNVGLLSEAGMVGRATDLRARAERLGKPAYLDTAAAAERLGRALAEQGGTVSGGVARADALDPDQLRRALYGRRPNLVITDIPYGEQTTWTGPSAARGVTGMLSALDEVLDEGVVIAVAARGRRVTADSPRTPVASFKIGTRAVALFRARG